MHATLGARIYLLTVVYYSCALSGPRKPLQNLTAFPQSSDSFVLYVQNATTATSL